MTTQTTNPKDYIELLQVFYISLTNGLIDKEDVIKWADSIITRDDQPDFFIIELSLCGHKNINEIVTLISDYINYDIPKISGRVILGLLYNQYINQRISLRKVATSVEWLVWQSNLSDEEKDFMYGLEDYYDCAEQGIYGTVDSVEQNMLRFLKIYKDFQLDNFPNWPEVNKTVDVKLSELLVVVKNEQQQAINLQAKNKWWKFW